MSGPKPTCGCQPPRSHVIARYSNAVYTEAPLPADRVWECSHGRLWRASPHLFASCVWRLLSLRQERRHRRRTRPDPAIPGGGP